MSQDNITKLKTVHDHLYEGMKILRSFPVEGRYPGLVGDLDTLMLEVHFIIDILRRQEANNDKEKETR